jgi:KUP system potassium uptake protein
MPAILLNYFGQGALLLTDPAAVSHPFYRMAPAVLQLPLVLLATVATVIASQAVISGVFSVSRQAIQLGLLPRADIVHTSESTIGQIYVPVANWAMLFGVICLIIAFGSSSEIASAYGIAVSLTMVLEISLVLYLALRGWRWPLWALVAIAALLLFDLSYLAANSLKISNGGWFPLVLSAILVLLMTTWTHGSRLVREQVQCQQMPIDVFLGSVSGVPRVSGTAIFLSRIAEGIPHSLLHNLKHNKVLHERVVLLSLIVEEEPKVPAARRLEIENLGSGFHRIKAHFGFSEELDVPQVLQQADQAGMRFDMMDTTFFLGRETVVPTSGKGMVAWREHLFGWMWKSAARAMDFLKLPPNRVVELGTQVEI